MANKTKITEHQGQEVNGYLSGNGTNGNIVLLHDWWGCTQSVRNLSNRLANLGHKVLALDYYQDTLPETVTEAEKKLWSVDMTDITEIFIAKSVEYLGKAHLVGMGFGSSLALIAQARVNNIRSITCAYGLPPKLQVPAVRCPFMYIRAQKNVFEDSNLINHYLSQAPVDQNNHCLSQVMNHDVDAEFLNENNVNFDFKRLKATCEAISNWVGTHNRDYPAGYF